MRKRIVIIGAGVSGLAAAVKLASSEQELDITILESRRDSGGRTRSFIDEVTGDEIDNGQHLMMGCYSSTIEYLKTIGSYEQLDIAPSLRIPFYSSEQSEATLLFLPKWIPAPINLAFGVLRSTHLSWYEKLALVRLGSHVLFFKDDRLMKEATCDKLLAVTNQPEILINKLWEPLILATMNTPVTQASAQVFINILRILFTRDKFFSSLLFPSKGLSSLLIDPAIHFLREHKCIVHYGATITDIKSNNNTVSIYSDNDTLFDTYDAAINAATTFTHSGEYLKFSPIINAYLWIDKKILDTPIAGLVGTNIQWCFPKTSQFSSQCLACTTSAGDKLATRSNEEIAAMYWKEIQDLVPEARYASLIHYRVIKEKKATPLLTPALHAARPHTTTDDRNVFNAGDLTQNALPFTIESAVRNGQFAAKKTLEYLFPDIL